MPDLIKDSLTNIYKTTLSVDNDEVIIGDEKSTSFVPQIKFSKWGGENSLTLKLPPDLIASNSPVLSAGKLEIKDAKTGFYVNPPEGENLKFGTDFYEKPVSNKVIYQIDDWENVKKEFNFWYQPPLKNINPDGSTWEDTGHGISTRPADVNGSWAIYHKTKANYIVGQTNYQTGKAYHDYRVKYIDSDGISVWCDTNYDLILGQRIVTIPLDFWNNAKYPIKANDTIGTTAIGASDDFGNLNGHKTNRFTMGTSDGICTNMKICLWVADGVGNVKMAIYTNHTTGGDHPENLVVNSSTGGVAVAHTDKPTIDSEWTSGNQTASLTANTKYHLAWCVNDADIYVAWDTTTGYRCDLTTGMTYAAFPLDPFGSPLDVQGSAEQFSIYATFTPSGATVALTGTVTSATEANIVAGGKTIILTLTGDTWLTSAGGLFDAQRQNIINGLDSAQSEANGWDAEVKAKIPVTDVVRTSDTIVTITLTAEAGYDITANETITATIPFTATTLTLSDITASPTFTVSYVYSWVSGGKVKNII